MKRFSEKVKDIVDVRSYRVLSDLLSEPSQTVSNYHFGDATADLMVRWLDEISNTTPGRNCRAIAGDRGVGKSHFLAAIGAIASHPEVRSSISEPHVSNAAQRLLRRHYPVINVRRGTRTTLGEELAAAAASAFDRSEEQFSGSAEAVIEKIKSLAGELPAIVLVDTAPDRSAPVERNDGDVLAKISTACSKLGVFVGLALDDDIAEADGSNLAVSQSFVIDYLDPEHLHKVVNSLIFPKRTRMQAVLTGVYTHFRDTVPHFRWSEHRFVSLYPLHPATLDLAPFIRAYVPNFALLGFASEAGEKIQGRPADSLVGYEEIFDATEADLRRVGELESAFTAYDELVARLVAELPATERHQSKLILKTLLILSLGGKGSTVDDVVAAMMIVDNGDIQESRLRIEGTLNACVQALPNAMTVDQTGEFAEYSFKIGSNKLALELDELAGTIPNDEVVEAYFRAVGVRFPELSDAIINRSDVSQVSQLKAQWRGAFRYGSVSVYTSSDRSDVAKVTDPTSDWELQLRFDGTDPDRSELSGKSCSVVWIADQLRTDEKRILAANHVLKSNVEFRAKHGEQLSALIQTYSRLVEILIERTLVGDAKLVIDGFDYNFSDTARERSSLGEMMSIMLEPLFESLYFEHPYFAEPLNDEAVEKFVKEVCGNSVNDASGNNALSLVFGEPLGLISSEGGKVTLKSKEEMSEVSSVKKVLGIFDVRGNKPSSIDSAFRALGETPLGLSRHAVRLVLVSMAANGLVEFVTSVNERISGRSLDLKLDWKLIDSIAKPSITKIPTERLVRWAGAIAGDDSVRSLDDSNDRSKVLQALVEISAQWAKRNPLEMLAAIPENEFTSSIWRDSIKITEGYSKLVATIDEALVGNIDLAVCVERICEEFSDRPRAFYAVRSSVQVVENFGSAHSLRGQIRKFLAECDVSNDRELEDARSALLSHLMVTETDPSEAANRELGYAWEKFRRLYTDTYISVHNTAKSISEPRAWLESAAGKDRWIRFSSLLACSPVQERFGKRFREILRRLKNMQCNDDPARFLTNVPRCGCSLKLRDAETFEQLTNDARRMFDEAIWFFERLVVENVEEIRAEIAKFPVSEGSNGELEIRAKTVGFLDSGGAVNDISEKELDILVASVSGTCVLDMWQPPSFGSYESSEHRAFQL